MLPRFFASLAKPTTAKSLYPLTPSSTVRSVFVARRAFSSFRTLRAEGRPAGRPKGHTGRLPARPRTRKTTTTSEDGTVVAKAAPKPKKAAAKTKAAKPKQPKKKKAVAKPKKPAKKVLTEEQKLAVAAKKKRDEVRALKLAALVTPTLLPTSPYRILFNQVAKGAAGGSIPGAAKEALAALSAGELEEMQQVATSNSAKNVAAKEAFTAGLTPQQVRVANNARAKLRRLGYKGWTRIQDSRTTRPPSAFILFVKERYATGDMEGTPISAAGKMLGQEWKSLPESDKTRYNEEYQRLRQNYERELKQLYGKDMFTAKDVPPAAAAAAASA